MKPLPLRGLTSGMESTKGASMERAVRADDSVTTGSAPFARKFDGAFDGFCSGVREENLSATTEQSIESDRNFCTGHAAVEI